MNHISLSFEVSQHGSSSAFGTYTSHQFLYIGVFGSEGRKPRCNLVMEVCMPERLSWAVSKINRIKVKEDEDSSFDGESDMDSLLFDVRSRSCCRKYFIGLAGLAMAQDV